MNTLQQPLFNIESLVHDSNSVNAILQIDQQNEILTGHFPGQPVVPGACMLQIIKDVLSVALNTSLQIKRADNIKFLSLVQPAATTLNLNIMYQIADAELKVNAGLIFGDTVCMKLQAIFVERS